MTVTIFHLIARAGSQCPRARGNCNGRQRRPQRSFPEGGEKLEDTNNNARLERRNRKPGVRFKRRAFTCRSESITLGGVWQARGTRNCACGYHRPWGVAHCLRSDPFRMLAESDIERLIGGRGGSDEAPATFHSRTKPRARQAIGAGKPATQTKGTTMLQTRRNQRSEKAGAIWPWPLSP